MNPELVFFILVWTIFIFGLGYAIGYTDYKIFVMKKLKKDLDKLSETIIEIEQQLQNKKQ